MILIPVKGRTNSGKHISIFNKYIFNVSSLDCINSVLSNL